MNQNTEWKHFFPYKEARNEQIIAIDFAIKQILSGKKKIILELGLNSKILLEATAL